MVSRGVLAAVLLLLSGTSRAAGNFTLNILHLNDTHSNLLPVSLRVLPDSAGGLGRTDAGGVALIAAEVRRAKHEEGNVLFLHAGDLVQGTLFYTVYGGRADAAVYNAMGLDAMALGNHEFDRGSEGLSLLLDEVLFPVVCANISVGDDTLLAGRVAPFTVLSTGGERIGVIGLITEELCSVSSPSDQTVALSALESGRSAVEALSLMGIDKVVVLSHLGYPQDIRLAESLPGVDVIVGGHTHTVLGRFEHLGLVSEGDYPTVVTGPDGENVLIVTAWRYGAMLGNLIVDFDPDGRVVDWSGSPLILTTEDTRGTPGLRRTEPDPLVSEMVEGYASVLQDFQSEFVAIAEDDLPNVRVPGGSLPMGSVIAPIVCDAMLWKANRLGTGADIALQNAGGVRIDVPRGEITIGTVYTLLPFGNTMTVLDLSGRQVKDLLEEALSSIFDLGLSDGTFPYVAGMRYTASRGAPSGSRVTSVEVAVPTGGYAPLDTEATYRLVTNSFVSGGGDGYGSLSGVPGIDTGFIDAEIVAEYFRELGTVYPVEQRVFLGE
ncbi:MAG: 5'-nucleotidase C-terminal domain-containing protein [Candidatus Fermentibacteraceae bacterium]